VPLMAFQPKFEAVIFDLDGVITKTALVHASAWKKMFDEYLISRKERFGEAFTEFTHAGDYLPYVDGKPRYNGVSSFLESRKIDIPFGDPGDDPVLETVSGLGNRKNIMFNKVLDEEGVEVYESTVEILQGLKKAGVRIGVASSSKNCLPVLERAGLIDFFETRVDGVVSAETGLNGKPEPDIFTTACDNLGIAYHRAVVVEDAVSGVQAGKKGNFGFVLGIAREDNIKELYVGGADVVVEDMAEIGLEGINAWFETGMERDSWLLRYFDYQLESERSREALLAVGNGYFGTRGALEESAANKVNYPGTYLSGLFNRLVSQVEGKDIENEDFVNITNWLPLTFRVMGGPWFSFGPVPNQKLIRMNRTLDMRTGVLEREMELEDGEGRITRISSSRFAGMDDPHRAGLRYVITPINYSGSIEFRSCISGDHKNAGVERYNDLNQDQLLAVSEQFSDDCMELLVKTSQSNINIAVCARNELLKKEGVICSDESGPGWMSQTFQTDASEGEEIVFEKLVSLATSRDRGVNDAPEKARSIMQAMGKFGQEMALSSAAWQKIWDRVDLVIGGDRESQRLVRLHMYHMMVSASGHHVGLDAGIGPRGLHGEAYRGHIFWDELYMLPLYNLYFPEVSKSVLMYRYQRLDAARAYAKEYGYEGAMFPWQSGSDGREETQVIHLNPLSGEWGDDYSSLQRHISLAIAYNTWNYYHATGDLAFMEAYGAEILLDISLFWVSKARKDESGERYHIDKVMGPDEFHEKLPGSTEGGISDNAYSNIMMSWMLDKSFRILQVLSPEQQSRILKKLNISNDDLERWKEIMHKLALNMDGDGVIEQFMGYFGLAELDWDHYKDKYDDIHRLDRILKAEGKSPDEYKLAKQADLLMSFYNLGEQDVTAIINSMGYSLPEHYLETNFDFYINRTSHGSTLSRLVHARLAWQMGRKEIGWELYMDALRSDLVDIQGGTTGEGIHCGVMAGTLCDVIFTFGGVNLKGDYPSINPVLPNHWSSLKFAFSYRGTQYQLAITDEKLMIFAENVKKEKIIVDICGAQTELPHGGWRTIGYK
ncbi:MAG: beta-phosphoglucomutase family hydrolase, partial [Bacteroides sp.]|nr:beta-phosphoglucomutase family hydrolase [Bacteroides sp.]